MKRLFLSLGLALLAFVLGVIVTWGYHRILPAPTESRLNNDLTVEFLRFSETEYGKYAAFEVANGGPETAYYWGYGKDSHCSDLIRQGRKIEQASHCWCGTGLEEQSLKKGETAKFEVRIPDNREPFEVGFDFIIGQNGLKRTIWSKEIERSAAEMSNNSFNPTPR